MGGELVKKTLALAGIYLGVIAFVVIGFEAYLRGKVAYMSAQGAGGKTEIGSGFLYQFGGDGGRRLVPNASVTLHNHPWSKRDVTVQTNSLGFRDDELPTEKSPEELRILALGDSITVGDFLPAELGWVEQAEQHLQRQLPEREVEVINAGVGAIGIREEVNILVEKGLRTQPDAVVLGFYLNDSRPPRGFPEELGTQGLRGLFNALRRRSVLADVTYKRVKGWAHERKMASGEFRWVKEKEDVPWRTDHQAFLELAHEARYDWGAGWQEDSWPLVSEQLDRLKSLSHEHGFSVHVVAFPVKYQVYAEFLDDTPQRKMAELVQERGFTFFDLLPLLRERRDLEHFYDQCHPRPQTYSMMGAAVAAHLASALLPQAGKTPGAAKSAETGDG